MSYEIIYDKQFVQLNNPKTKENNYIPMILSGSNNCYEAHVKWSKARRSRDWWNWSYWLKNSDNPIFGTENQILSFVDEYIKRTIDENVGVDKYDETIVKTEEDIKRRFGYYTSLSFGGGCKITSTQWYNLFKNGIKNALTIEQLANLGIYITFHHYKWNEYTYSIPVPEPKIIKTESDFWDEYNTWMNWKNTCVVIEKGENVIPSVSIRFSMHYDTVLHMLKRYRKKPKKNYTSVEVDHFYGLRFKSNKNYLYKYTKYGYRCIGYQSRSIKSFRTEKEANNYIKDSIRKGRMNAHDLEVVRINDKNYFKEAV